MTTHAEQTLCLLYVSVAVNLFGRRSVGMENADDSNVERLETGSDAISNTGNADKKENGKDSKKKEKQNQNQNQNQNKKQNKKGPRIPSMIPKKDHHLRSTYIYKIGKIMSLKNLQTPGNKSTESFETFSRMYLHHMDLVSKKAVLKLHPDIKRTVCKKCSRLQIIGFNKSCTLRIVNESKKQVDSCDTLVNQCICGNVKRFPIGKNPAYKLYSEQEGKLFEAPDNNKRR